MVKPHNLGDTLVVQGPVIELSRYLVFELRHGDLVLSNLPHEVRINTASEISTRRLMKAAGNYPGVRVIKEVPNVQSVRAHR